MTKVWDLARDYIQHYAELIPNGLPSDPTTVGFIFHQNQCLNPKWNPNTFSCLSPIREPVIVSVKQTGNQIPTLAWLSKKHRESYPTASPQYFSVKVWGAKIYLTSGLWWFNGLIAVEPPGYSRHIAAGADNFSQLPAQAMKMYRTEILHEQMSSREFNLLKQSQ